MSVETTTCKNCKRFTPMPFKHSFSTELEQTKNQSWRTHNTSWIVTPTASLAPALSGTTFCSGDCLFSYLFSHDLLSNKNPDQALHFFKRTDEQRQWIGSQLLVPGEESRGSMLASDAAAAAVSAVVSAGGLGDASASAPPDAGAGFAAAVGTGGGGAYGGNAGASGANGANGANGATGANGGASGGLTTSAVAGVGATATVGSGGAGSGVGGVGGGGGGGAGDVRASSRGGGGGGETE
jgi:hypothetical protein